MAVSRRPNAIRRSLHLGTALVFGALVAAGQTHLGAAADWLPDGAIYTLHISQPAELLDLATDLNIPLLLPGTPTGNSANRGFQLLVSTLAEHSATDITYALYPGDNAVWVIDASDATVLDALQHLVKTLASANPSATFYQEYPGDVAVWSVDGKQFFARTGNRLLLANRRDLLKALFTPHPQSKLASSTLYVQARNALIATGKESAAWAFVNMAALNQYPPVQKGLAPGSEPFDVILNGGWKQSLRSAKWLATGLTVDGKKLRLHLVTDGALTATAAGAFTLPDKTGVLPNLMVPRELAAATLWRDLGKFYSLKDTLFPHRTSAGILAENFMEIFFTGRNLTDEVFGKFQPQVRLVIATQAYDPAVGTPDEQYPAAALIFRVERDAADFGEVLEEAWQKAVGLANFTRGQQALPGIILDRQTYAGVPFTFGYFSVRREKDRAHLPSRFNLRPAIVRDGPYIILSTTDGLARDLIDAVNKEDGRRPTTRSDAHTILDVNSPAEIAALLNVNKAAMVRQSVLSSGKKPDEAARQFDQNVAWLKKVNRATLSLFGSQADLDLELK